MSSSGRSLADDDDDEIYNQVLTVKCIYFVINRIKIAQLSQTVQILISVNNVFIVSDIKTHCYLMDQLIIKLINI